MSARKCFYFATRQLPTSEGDASFWHLGLSLPRPLAHAANVPPPHLIVETSGAVEDLGTGLVAESHDAI